ncbi:hypothetical protein LTR65_006143 [Meristemomyces frigidus]
MDLIADGVASGYDHEYLAFGTISGEAHRAVSAKELISRGVFSLWPRFAAYPPGQAPGEYELLKIGSADTAMRALRTFQRLAEPFGEDFLLPIMVCLIAEGTWQQPKIDQFLPWE